MGTEALNNSRFSTPIQIPVLRELVASVCAQASSEAANARDIAENYNGAYREFMAGLWRRNAATYNRLATDLDYIEKTRLSLLPPLGKIDIFLRPGARDAVKKFIRGEDYTIDEFLSEPDWFAAVAGAVEDRIPKARIHKAARRYRRDHPIVPILSAQVQDDDKKNETTELLRLTPFGRSLLQQANELGYEIHFTDMKAYNNVLHDLLIAQGGGSAFAVQFSRHIFVGSYGDRDDIPCVLSLVHEIAHALQLYRHLKFDSYSNREAADGVDANIKQYSSMMEAHSIAAEFIVAAELLEAGIKPEFIYPHLKNIDPDTIDYLMHEPVRFIAVVSQGSFLRRQWGFQSKEMNYSPKIAREFASSLPPLAMSLRPYNPLPDVDEVTAQRGMIEAPQRRPAAEMHA